MIICFCNLCNKASVDQLYTGEKQKVPDVLIAHYHLQERSLSQINLIEFIAF